VHADSELTGATGVGSADPGAYLLRTERGARTQEVEEAAMWSTIQWGQRHPRGLQLPPRLLPEALDSAYKRCGVITADYAKTFYLVRTRERRRVRVRGRSERVRVRVRSCGSEAGTAGVLEVPLRGASGVLLWFPRHPPAPVLLRRGAECQATVPHTAL